jgi:hypothetical protein
MTGTTMRYATQTTGIATSVAPVDKRHHLGSRRDGRPGRGDFTGFLGGGSFGGGSIDAGALDRLIPADGLGAAGGAEGGGAGNLAPGARLAFGSNSQS